MKVLLDTNIILDLFDTERRSSGGSIILFELLEKQGYEMLISADSVSTVVHILRKKSSEAVEYVREMLQYFKVVKIDEEVILQAIEISEKYHMSDYEDAQIIASVLSDIDCAAIITNDQEFLSVNIKEIEIVSVLDVLKQNGYIYNEMIDGWITHDPAQDVYGEIQKRGKDDR